MAQQNLQAITFRLHRNDKMLMMKLLSDDKLNYQKFANYCMQAYLNGDPSILKVLKDWKMMDEIPKDIQDKYTLSHRERAKILDDIAVEDIATNTK